MSTHATKASLTKTEIQLADACHTCETRGDHVWICDYHEGYFDAYDDAEANLSGAEELLEAWDACINESSKEARIVNQLAAIAALRGHGVAHRLDINVARFIEGGDLIEWPSGPKGSVMYCCSMTQGGDAKGHFTTGQFWSIG